MMQIICNGEKKEIHAGTTLLSFLAARNLNPETVFVECNGVILNKDEYAVFELPEDARLELIRFVGGG